MYKIHYKTKPNWNTETKVHIEMCVNCYFPSYNIHLKGQFNSIYKKIHVSLIDLLDRLRANLLHPLYIQHNLTWLLSLSNGECTCSESLPVESLSKEPEAWTFFAFVGTNEGQKQTNDSVVILCSKITGVQQKDLSSLWEKRVIQKAKGIIRQLEHILHIEFTVIKTNCYYCSFIHSALKLLNIVDTLIECSHKCLWDHLLTYLLLVTIVNSFICYKPLNVLAIYSCWHSPLSL